MYHYNIFCNITGLKSSSLHTVSKMLNIVSTPFSLTVVSIFPLPMNGIVCGSFIDFEYLTLFKHCTGNFHPCVRTGNCWKLNDVLQLWTWTFQNPGLFQTWLWIIFEARIQIIYLFLKVLSLLQYFLLPKSLEFNLTFELRHLCLRNFILAVVIMNIVTELLQ